MGKVRMVQSAHAQNLNTKCRRIDSSDVYVATDHEALDEAAHWNSVLDLFEESVDFGAERASAVSSLIAKPNVRSLSGPLRSLLSSSRDNDDISAELVEVVGFDEIELAMELLNHRADAVNELERLESSISRGDHAAPVVQDNNQPHVLSSAASRHRIQQQLEENAARPLTTGVGQAPAEVLPHVYTSSSVAQGSVLSQMGSKYSLPLGTERHQYEEFEEVIIPPSKPVPPKSSERLISVSELDPLARGSFPGYKTLNRIQSIVYPTAYGTNENMLICAPTGAGKTDVAMLTILRVLDQHRLSQSNTEAIGPSSINKHSFKIIYVAPMKALASEIVRKLGKRLRWLSIEVRELTGDMQMTKAEIAQTQIIVTTPEKWDVVTRKPTGEGELASSLKLLIIDEVHLLNEERGAVIETIVARTLRQVESSQSVIRIVGLSATLPNYIDVAEFLCVSRQKGLFYFDSSFRPIPLEQHFLGIRGKPNSPQSRKNLDRVTFQKVSELVHEGHQVMVFVHARKETVKSAISLMESAIAEGVAEDFLCEEHPQWSTFRRSIGESRNKEMKTLFDSGFGIHHAGMLRTDRNMMERMFEARAIKVLCCTATLAWGVNLPAHAVVIKGTQVYDSSKGAFVDLSVLDVLQVFGRAGRPGLETSGEGYICTPEEKLQHYLDAVLSQNPIESQFRGGMIDALNAEVSLGTVANLNDAIQWLGYTYLFVRMRKNPSIYGIPWEAPVDDPQLGSKRAEYVKAAVNKLVNAGMMTIEPQTDAYVITDLGRIAAKFYIRHASIEIFNEKFRPKMTEADVLDMLCKSTEFDQIQVRENELPELGQLRDIIPCDVKGAEYVKESTSGPSAPQRKTGAAGRVLESGKPGFNVTSSGKVNILLQGYISRLPVEDFALVSDAAYAAQNGARIIRALLEIGISRKWANVTAVLLGMSQAIEKRLWPFDQPLKQFQLKSGVFYGLERWADEWSVAQLASLSAVELGELVHLNERHGQAILDAAKQFPTVDITYDLRPLVSDILKITVHVRRAFTWNQKLHGTSEPFWVWVEDHEGTHILQLSHLAFRQTTEVLDVDFLISIPNNEPPPSVTIRFVSDRWMGAEDELQVPLDSVVMPRPFISHTRRLDLPFISLAASRQPVVEGIFGAHVKTLNSIQTQTFWSLIHTQSHALLCAPVGCGKSVMAHIVAWSTIFSSETARVLVVVPRRDQAGEVASDLRALARGSGVTIDGINPPNPLAPRNTRSMQVVTAMHLLGALTNRNPIHPLAGIDLVVCESLELLDPNYELAVSLLRHATQRSPTRFIGFCSSLSDPVDLGAWLGIPTYGLHSFKPSDRDHSLLISTQTFTIPQSAALFKAMIKPAHSAISTAPVDGASIVFVPSRGQCRSVALDLITQCTLQTTTEKAYLPSSASEVLLEDYLARLQDRTLADFLTRGVGFYHEGVPKSDRHLMLRMYAEGIVRVLIVPRASCWSLPVRASVVVVMGTQYFDVEAEGSTPQLRDYSLTDLIRMQSRAVEYAGLGRFYLFCQAESKDSFIRFLNEGLPLESRLLETDDLHRWYDKMRRSKAIQDRQQAVDALSFTFLARRIASNPVYYDCTQGHRDESLSRVVDQLEDAYMASQTAAAST
ncbi:hypothetical protein HGRIS_009728 [Hohenbuehelia grisea]|uniref:Sec63-domain-containing protein n=1 Tax=Hohenbuehelia grisea TaxID=104357 RepID=A0ABR3J2L9_9AGAR